eukprot:TRINITY_DN1603_c0_g1_i15.p1 TRINITY_DN1603_c0_g1~~TRINITY_DN1603_c0_g1_i15.p1  ORF type:complete len:329 (-),score=72.53 TRINITY_DN1603_c0_g1_i15:92-1078(-)
MSSPSPWMLFQYPPQFTAFSKTENLQFLYFIQQQIFSSLLFMNHNNNEHTFPEINGKSTDEIIAHAKVWINSLICSASPPSVTQLDTTNNIEIDINNNNSNSVSPAISSDESTKKRKLVAQAPQYALDYLPYHVLQDIRYYLPLPYSYFFRLTCKRLYFIDKATKSDRSRKSRKIWWKETISPTACCAELASYGYLSCLRFVREREKPLQWDEKTTKNAAQGGHLDCLKYAIENKCEQYGNLVLIAIDGGHTEILKYLHQNGWRLDSASLIDSLNGGHLGCLKYMLEQNIELNLEYIKWMRFSDFHMECIKLFADMKVKLKGNTHEFK